jgi:hypothetical protein
MRTAPISADLPEIGKMSALMLRDAALRAAPQHEGTAHFGRTRTNLQLWETNAGRVPLFPIVIYNE